ncbi:pyrroline-5-carboxylate reductase [Desulfobulbus propionicus DSM 2032]|uniref:Pyrroline-5-carboxylate reductase n=1 Tax=Desulfobulbus propionicus (strain ATCC 33891 / DSM 2032 / VKM B-1956 / 1pr3) TaxID=577650 RepID=A0A7U3YM46_DESPD|nr:pyrroline-5-carboxylate reductase [Desulfobulbus propionicus]ADW17738.1 pyrroline-5-carboxylate reductase [Desulfobulbus propionicus DSM 2032]
MRSSIDTLGFVGGGQMAEAMIRGIVASGLTTAEKIMVAEPSVFRRDALLNQYGVVCTSEAEMLCHSCKVLVLAIKPQLAATVLAEYRPFLTSEHLVISIMAGVTLHTLAGWLGDTIRLIRVMPNTPALVLAGATAFSPNHHVTDQDRKTASALFSAVGSCVEVPESQLDAVTGLSGSGPGYVFTFIEAMIDGGVLAGLPRPVAEQLVLQTVYGSAKLALETGDHPAVLKGKVTSPGGTTIAGIQVLEDGALRGVVMGAIEAATERSRELGA